MEHIQDRYSVIAQAYESYAPRYEGDEEYCYLNCAVQIRKENL